VKRFIRNLLSGYLFILLALLVEVLVFLILQYKMDDIIVAIFDLKQDDPNVQIGILISYVLFRAFAYVLAFIIFFKVLNKAENPEFKIPWLVGILLLPFFFSIMYFIFGNHGLRKKDRKIVDGSKSKYEHQYIVDEQVDLGTACGTFKYINATTKLGCHDGNRVKYYKTGEEFFPEFIESLKTAKEFIFIEFFIISDGKYWSEVKDILIEKANEGVEIRLIYDDMGCSGTIASNTARKLRKLGIKCYKFHPFRPILSGMYNNRDHRKIVIIDHEMAYTGGMNLADEYGNVIKRFGYWKDTMVRIEGSAINNLIITFLQNYDLACGKLSDYDKYIKYEYKKYDEDGYVMPFGDGPGGIDDALIGEQTYINILHYAKHEVFISTPYLVPTYGLIDALRNAAMRGVKVHLIVPGIPDKKLVYKVAETNFKYLMESGIKIHRYTPGFNHMKTILADGKLAMVGTINFDFRSLVHHYECGAVLYKVDCLKEIKDDFLEMIKSSEEVPENFKQNFFIKLLCAILKIITPLM